MYSDFEDVTSVTHFVDLAVKIYQFCSLKMTLWGPKHVAVTVLIKWCEFYVHVTVHRKKISL
jgi:hypothetical protein